MSIQMILSSMGYTQRVRLVTQDAEFNEQLECLVVFLLDRVKQADDRTQAVVGKLSVMEKTIDKTTSDIEKRKLEVSKLSAERSELRSRLELKENELAQGRHLLKHKQQEIDRVMKEATNIKQAQLNEVARRDAEIDRLKASLSRIIDDDKRNQYPIKYINSPQSSTNSNIVKKYKTDDLQAVSPNDSYANLENDGMRDSLIESSKKLQFENTQLRTVLVQLITSLQDKLDNSNKAHAEIHSQIDTAKRHALVGPTDVIESDLQLLTTIVHQYLGNNNEHYKKYTEFIDQVNQKSARQHEKLAALFQSITLLNNSYTLANS